MDIVFFIVTWALLISTIIVLIFNDKIRNKFFSKEEEVSTSDQIETNYNEAIRKMLNDKTSTLYKLIEEQKNATTAFNTNTGAINQSIMGLDMQTKNLLNILNNDRDRGSWTEFKIKDLLDSKGFQEGVHYQYNKQNEQGKRPDFVFKLPDNKKVNLDAKFPWDGYKRIIAKAEELKDINLSQDERENKQKELKTLERNFINTSIKEKIKTTSTRDGYIDTENGTVDYVMMWIPVEQVFQLILNSTTSETIDSSRQEISIIEYAFRRNVILVGPVGLLVQLEIIRNALNIFNIENSVKDLLKANNNFVKEVINFISKLADVKTKLSSLNKSFKNLTIKPIKDLNIAYQDVLTKNEKPNDETLEKIIEEYDQLGD